VIVAECFLSFIITRTIALIFSEPSLDVTVRQTNLNYDVHSESGCEPKFIIFPPVRHPVTFQAKLQ